MKIAINAISIKGGGSAVVLEKLLEQFVALRPDYAYHVVVNTRLPRPPIMEHASVHVRTFPWAERHPLLTIAWYMLVCRRWLARSGMDVLYSTTNYLPATSPVPMVLLVQNASYFCPTYFLDGQPGPLRRLLWKLKRAWVRRSVRAAARLTLQTSAMAGWVARSVPQAAAKVTVIPHGPGFLEGKITSVFRILNRGTIELLYVSKYGPQKNFTVALAALAKLRAAGIPAQLHLTLEEGTGTTRVLEKAQAMGVGRAVMNHGDVGYEPMRRLYERADVLLFPSLCESFGFPMVEAMAYALPLVVADTEGNRDVCGDAALYFPSADAGLLAQLIEQLYRDGELYQRCSRQSAERAGRFDWAAAGRQTLAILVEGTTGQ